MSRELEYYIYFEYFLPATRVKNKFIGKIKRFYKRLKKERLPSHWCSGHSTSINVCGIWGIRVGV